MAVSFMFMQVLCVLLYCVSALYRGSGIRLREGGGSEGDSDVSGIKSLEDPVNNNIWEICKTVLRVYSVLLKTL